MTPALLSNLAGSALDNTSHLNDALRIVEEKRISANLVRAVIASRLSPFFFSVKRKDGFNNHGIEGRIGEIR